MSTEFRVGGIPCHRNSVSTEFRVDGGIPCRRGNSVSTGEFHVNGGIPCQRGNSMSMGKFHVDGGIPCVSTGNSMLTEFSGYLTVHLFGKNSKKCFDYKYLCFFFCFNNALAD